MSAKASGSDAKSSSSSAHNRQHNDGSSGRAYTTEQKAAVIRVRRCGATNFYDILDLESERTTVTDSGIKKAYRKLSLLTHPDKNGYDGADEAFKMVSRAFQILSDPDKKKRYDQFGGDPDSRFSSASAASSGGNPFSGAGGFARAPPGFGGAGMRGGGMFEEEISPEELFRQFFAGGGGFGGPFGGGLFNASPGFVFNMGGGPGIRVHQFGGGNGGQWRRGPTAAGATARDPPTAGETIRNLLPLLLLFLIPILSSLFSGFGDGSTYGTPKVPVFNLDDPKPPVLTEKRQSTRLGVTYYVNPEDVEGWSARKWGQMDTAAENKLVNTLHMQCNQERSHQDAMFRDAQGWLFVDQDKYDAAKAYELKSCKRMKEMGVYFN